MFLYEIKHSKAETRRKNVHKLTQKPLLVCFLQQPDFLNLQCENVSFSWGKLWPFICLSKLLNVHVTKTSDSDSGAVGLNEGSLFIVILVSEIIR